MPELPEVETIVNDLKKADLAGKTIKKAEVWWSKSIATPSEKVFLEEIRGQKIRSISRRAKFLVIQLSDYDLAIHLRMTGRLRLTTKDTPQAKEERVRLHLDNGLQLRYEDTRKFGRLYLLTSTDELFAKLGPEPLGTEITSQLFAQRLIKHSRRLKPLLLDQTFVAGLGNIYVDEALWEAQLHPMTKASDLTMEQGITLFRAIQKVLKKGIKSQGTTLGSGKSNFYRLHGQEGKNRQTLQVFRRTGLPCPRCQKPIIRLIVAQRSTHVCPVCQVL